MQIAKWQGWTGQPEGLSEHVSCLDCKRWKNKWNTVPRSSGCSIWADVCAEMEDAARTRPLDVAGIRAAEAASPVAAPMSFDHGPSFSILGTLPPLVDGMVCPRFSLNKGGAFETMTEEQEVQLASLQEQIASCYAMLCKKERDCLRYTRYDLVPEGSLRQGIVDEAEALAAEFRPCKTQVSELDSLIRDGSKWQCATAEEQLRSIQDRLEDANACLAGLEHRYDDLLTSVRTAPERYEASVEQDRLDQLESRQQEYDERFHGLMRRYHGQLQQLGSLGLFARGRKKEIEQELEYILQNLAALNDEFEGTGVQLSQLPVRP